MIVPPMSGWRGGKSLLLNEILPRICEHKTYVEPFAGAGWVFFQKEPAKVEVLNDINGDIANLYRVVRDQPHELEQRLLFTILSRELFNEIRDQRPTDPVARAWRFLYLLKASFSANMTNFGYRVKKINSAYRFKTLLDNFWPVHERLRGCQIEQLPWWDVLARYDRPETFFYLDPPYYGHENDYGKNIFAKGDFSFMASLLKELRGRFMLSINDLPETREIFNSFNITPVKTHYSVNAGKGGNAKYRGELLIANY